MNQDMIERKQNTEQIRQYFNFCLDDTPYTGIFGVANFGKVANDLMPVQQAKLEEICQQQYSRLMQVGSIISIGIVYLESIIDCINVKKNGIFDKVKWNIYAREYQTINRLLNEITSKIIKQYGGISILATLEGMATEVSHVDEYFRHTISHRVVSEHAGLGWRGKNELVVNPLYSCAIRFASIVTTHPLLQNKKLKLSCGNCTACLEICPFLKKKDHIENYRENCRQYINALDLEDEVCGKCILACYRHGIFKDQFQLPK